MAAGIPQACVIEGDWYVELSKLANNLEHREELASSGNDYVLNHHTSDKLFEQWEIVIQQALLLTETQ
jgi:hypothetical protein